MVARVDPSAGTAQQNRPEQRIRAAELVAALSIATDLGTGQPLEHAVRTAVLAVRLGELAGASAEELADTYYVGLLHASGYTSNGHEAEQLFGDDALPPSIEVALRYVFARWDGRGFPDVGGPAIPLPIRLLHVSRDASAVLSSSGLEQARAAVESRSGAVYEPRLAALAASNLEEILDELDETRMWEHALNSEPPPAIWLSGDQIDAGFAAIAAIAGLKSPWLRGHSTHVAELAEAAAWRLGVLPESVTLLRRAALAQELGRVGVSNGIWDKPGPLGFGEWERVRLHAHFTERAFAQSAALAPIGRLAGSHHERLDGSGYHRGVRAPDLDRPARILAAADCYAAMGEARPYRPALDAAAAEAELLREADEGRLDAEVVDAVLIAAGHRVSQRAPELPAGLTPRELEVLLALVRGESNHAIGDGLGISAKTVGHHVQHIYGKAGVRSRAAAALWAFEHELVHAA